MDSFDIFDEWGNWIGTARPAGGGMGGCLGGIVVTFAIAIVFAIFAVSKILYILVREITHTGIQALKSGRCFVALLCLSIYWIPVLIAIFSVGFRFQEYLLQRNAIGSVALMNVLQGDCLTFINGEKFSESDVCLTFTVINNSNRRLYLQPKNLNLPFGDCFYTVFEQPEEWRKGPNFEVGISGGEERTYTCVNASEVTEFCSYLILDMTKEPRQLPKYSGESCTQVSYLP